MNIRKIVGADPGVAALVLTGCARPAESLIKRRQPFTIMSGLIFICLLPTSV